MKQAIQKESSGEKRNHNSKKDSSANVAFTDNRPEATTQLKVQQMANQPIQRKENKTGMPDSLKSGIENLSGLDMSDVKVHYNSPQPAQLQAHAFAQGNQIHIASGQEKHLPHEAWHVVQQKQGRVAPTKQLKGKVNINDDVGLENEADVMGAKAVQFRSNSKDVKNKSIAGHKIVQRYLIIGAHDFTRNVRNGADIDTTTDNVFDGMEAALNRDDAYELEVYNFIHANAGGLVKRQIKKWIEDNQGVARGDGKGIPAYGRKQQGRSYSNYVDAAKAIYGWVSSKPNRHQEKVLATRVYNNPVIEIHLNAVFTKIRQWIAGKANAAAIVAELDVDNPPGAGWDDYRRYFNRNAVGTALGQQIPGRFLAVLDNPAAFSMRNKIAVLHDLMKYFQEGSGTQGDHMLDDGRMPTFKATIRTGMLPRGIMPYNRPGGSHIPRNAITHGLVPADLAGERAADRLKDSQEETHDSFKFARQHQIPMWARHSFTAARMMQMVKEAGGDKGEISSVAWSIMAFWRQNYDHRQIPYHTLHEIMDFTPAFGLEYDPLNREAGLNEQNISKQLVDTIILKTSLDTWKDEIEGFFNKRPVGVGLIKTEASSGHTPNAKLVNIKAIVAPLAGAPDAYSPKTQVFYHLLNVIPANINLHNAVGTLPATNAAIEATLLAVFTALKNFKLP